MIKDTIYGQSDLVQVIDQFPNQSVASPKSSGQPTDLVSTAIRLVIHGLPQNSRATPGFSLLAIHRAIDGCPIYLRARIEDPVIGESCSNSPVGLAPVSLKRQRKHLSPRSQKFGAKLCFEPHLSIGCTTINFLVFFCRAEVWNHRKIHNYHIVSKIILGWVYFDQF